MKLIIDIPDNTYADIQEHKRYTDFTILDLIKAIRHGTPIPDNATVCDIEQIRADIEAARYGLINDGLDAALRIIDKHIEQKPGKWIEKDGWDGDVYYECSVCGEPFCLIDGTPTDNMYNYCPNCGAKMVEPQESEDKG